jgi:hypothetical protein
MFSFKTSVSQLVSDASLRGGISCYLYVGPLGLEIQAAIESR